MTATRRHPGAVGAVMQIPLPDDARALSTLPRIDYTDAFAAAAADKHSPAQWIRAMLQDAPARVRWQLWLGWTALGLRLGPPWQSDRVLGWKLTHSDASYALLAADSCLGLRAELLFCSEPHGLLFATLLQHTNPAARALWRAITPCHQRIVASLLTHGAIRAQSE